MVYLQWLYHFVYFVLQLPGSTPRGVSHAAVDTLLWQTFASVLVPGLTINRVCAVSLLALAKGAPRIPLIARKWTTTVIGLAIIPFIVHPIDGLVHYGMDHSVRKYLDLTPPKAPVAPERQDAP